MTYPRYPLDPYRAAFGITDLRQALVERAQTTLRHVVGARTVQSVVVERETIALEIDSILSEVGDKWGVSIEGILIKFVTPSDLAATFMIILLTVLIAVRV